MWCHAFKHQLLACHFRMGEPTSTLTWRHHGKGFALNPPPFRTHVGFARPTTSHLPSSLALLLPCSRDPKHKMVAKLFSKERLTQEASSYTPQSIQAHFVFIYLKSFNLRNMDSFFSPLIQSLKSNVEKRRSEVLQVENLDAPRSPFMEKPPRVLEIEHKEIEVQRMKVVWCRRLGEGG